MGQMVIRPSATDEWQCCKARVYRALGVEGGLDVCSAALSTLFGTLGLHRAFPSDLWLEHTFTGRVVLPSRIWRPRHLAMPLAAI